MVDWKGVDGGLLLIRLGLAAVFIAHGVGKLADTEATMGFFESLGMPGAFGVLVGLVELIAGAAMLLGTYTKYAGWAIAVIMVGAVATVKNDAGFMGGWEFEFVLFLMALAIVQAGPGRNVMPVNK